MEKVPEMNNEDNSSQITKDLEKQSEQNTESAEKEESTEKEDSTGKEDAQKSETLQRDKALLGDKNLPGQQGKAVDNADGSKDKDFVVEKRPAALIAVVKDRRRKLDEYIQKRNLEAPEGVLGGAFFSFLYFSGLIMYLELIFHFLIYQSIDNKIIYPVIFAIPFGALLAFITGLFPARMNKWVLWVVSAGLCTVYLVQLVYFSVFKVFFSLQILGMAQDAVSEFGGDIITAIRENIVGMIILLMPLLLLGLLIHRRTAYRRRRVQEQGLLLGGAVLFHLLALVSLLLFGRLDYSPYDLYFHSRVPDLLGQKLGITTMSRLDFLKLFSSEDELILADTKTVIIASPIPTEPPVPTVSPVAEPVQQNNTPTPTPLPTPTPIDTSPNVMDIDFQALADKEKDKTIKTLHNYFASVTPTNKNEYTGKFKGYNLIMITAEGFSPYAIHQEKTPTLYRLVREGFVFNNFYTALWQTSTSDGEYVGMTGLIPLGSRSMFRGRKNKWPFSLGHQFNQLGVASKAYHNHTYTYYQRNETHPNLGYLWKAKGNGLKLPSDCWPESDLEMIDATVDEYSKEEQFHVYYLTVSGHMNYTFAGNSMAARNRELVQELPYSEDAKAYLACQLELDKALEKLLSKLEEAGAADRTVIALSADHYPYGWEKYKLDELAGHEIDPDFEIYRNHFILWNPGMEENVIIDKPCSSLDILPTLSNLFGLEYDSRLLMGQDILSDAEPLVVLSNRSYITDKVMYNSSTRETTLLTEEPLPENYIKNLNNKVKNKFSVSKSILDEDYYRYVFPK